MLKNVANQKVALFAFTATTGLPKTGDGANLTPHLSKDFGAVTALTDATATEMNSTNAPGWYLFDVSQTETNADNILFTGKSTTANVVVVGKEYCTAPPNFTTQAIDGNGRLDVSKVAGTTQTAGDLVALINTVDDFLDSEVEAIKAKTDQLTFTVANQVDSNALSGGGGGGGGLDAAGVRAAVGLASANLDTQLGAIDDFLDTEVAAIKAKTDNLPADPADASDLAAAFATVNTKLNAIDDYIDSEVAAIKAKTDQLTFTTANRIDCQVFGLAADVVTAAAIAADAIGASELAASAVTKLVDGVWDAVLADHLAAGSTGVALQAAGSAGDPWSTAIPGAYAAGTAGYIVGTNVNATVSSRASQTSLDTLDDYVDSEVAAIKAKTDNLPADPADASDLAAAFATINTKLDTLDNFVDTEVAAIKAKTDQLTFTVANQVDSNALSAPGSALVGGRIVAVYKRELDTFEADLILTIDGEPVSFNGSGTLTVRDAAGTLVFAALASSLITDAGDSLKHLHWSQLTPGFTGDRLYSLRAVITDGVDSYTINDVFTVLA